MRIRAHKLRRDESGAAAIEMAISLPILVGMIYGIFTLGQLFESNAGIQHALGEGARYANLCLSATNGACSMPTSTQIAARVNSKLFGTRNGTFDAPTVDTSTATSGYITITVRYHQTMNFLMFTGPTINVTRSKRVYLADTPTATSAQCSSAGATAPVSCSVYL
ncbi:MAG: TadE/TadG family type IV pilus assembly protein [Bacillota bacterium]